MKKLLNGEYIDMTDEEFAELKNEQNEEISEQTNDRVEELAIGLSKATSLAKVRAAAENVLGK